MSEKYGIKGIEKIIEKVGKEQLAKHYRVEENADFQSLITEDLRQRLVPNGLEIATYELGDMEEVYKGGYNIYTNRMYEEYCENTGKALLGINFWFNEGTATVSDLFFYVDEPIKDEEIQKMGVKISIGGTDIRGYLMRKQIL